MSIISTVNPINNLTTYQMQQVIVYISSQLQGKGSNVTYESTAICANSIILQVYGNILCLRAF